MIRSRLVNGMIAATIVGVSLAGCTAAPAPSASPTSSSPSRIRLPRDPVAYFFGDSWTTGYDAAPDRGFPHVVGEALGWRVTLGPDSSGAGYVYTYNPYHPVFPEVTKTIDHISADVIVLQGSVNDTQGPLDELAPKIRETVQRLRATSDDTPIVMVGPAPYQADVQDELVEIDRTETATAKALHIPYISPLRERWFPAGIIDSLIDDHQHPTTAGHAYFGGRLAADLARLTLEHGGSSTKTPSPTATS